MPDVNNPNPSTPETAAAEEPKVQLTPITLPNGVSGVVELHARKVRGGKEGETEIVGLLKWATDKFDSLLALGRAIGVPKLMAAVYRDCVKPACFEASSEAFDEEGNFSPLKWVAVFVEQFEPASRRKGGPTKKDIETKMASVVQELTPLAIAMSTGTKLSEEDLNKVTRLKLELDQLSAAHAKKTRVGKAPAAAKAS